MTPFVSVIMPAYNSERYIADAIGSLTSQSGVRVEVIVVSDGSTDGTEGIVRALAANDPRIRLLAEPHRGVAAARNKGLTATTADLVTFLDSDDLCAPGRLRRHAQYLQESKETAAVISDLVWFDVAGSDGTPSPDARTLRLQSPQLSTVTFRRTVFDTIGLCDESFTYAEDVDLLLRLWETRAIIHFDGEVATYHRRHDANMTNDHEAATRYFLRALHRSLARRRQANLLEPLPPMFAARNAAAKDIPS